MIYDLTGQSLGGIVPVLAYEHHLLDTNGRPNYWRTLKIAKEAVSKGVPLILDVERWPQDIRTASLAAVQETIEQTLKLIRWAKSVGATVWAYAPVGPLREHLLHYHVQRATTDTSGYFYDRRHELLKRKGAWDLACDAFKPVLDALDGVCPSVYLFYGPLDYPDYMSIAETHVRETIAQAKRVTGKPVIPFLWWQFHDGNKTLKHAGQYMPADLFKLAVDTAKAHADGVALWAPPRDDVPDDLKALAAEVFGGRE